MKKCAEEFSAGAGGAPSKMVRELGVGAGRNTEVLWKALGKMYIYIPNYFFTAVGVYFLTEDGKILLCI